MAKRKTGLEAKNSKGKIVEIKEGDIIQIFLLDRHKNILLDIVRLVKYSPKEAAFILVKEANSTTGELLRELKEKYPAIIHSISFRYLGNVEKNPEELWDNASDMEVKAPMQQKQSLLEKIKNFFK